MVASKVTADHAIESLDDMLGTLNTIRAHLSDESEQLTEEWAMLGIAGGQRADHAAQLLKRLRPHFEGLEQFARTCNEQLAQTIANPFGK